MVNLVVLAWVVLATLAVVAVTTAMVWPLAVRHGKALAGQTTYRKVVSACLSGSTPMDILLLYSTALAPPDVKSYRDDQIAVDPALERLTRWPTGTVRPSVPVPDEDDASGTAMVPAPPPATSHRAPRRPIAGWWEETMTPRLARWFGRTPVEQEEEPPPQTAFGIEIPPHTAVTFDQDGTVIAVEPLRLADDWREQATICPTCKGTQRVTLSITDAETVPCPDCTEVSA